MRSLSDVERDELAAVLAPGGIRVAVQPIVRASDLAVIGHEALARMHPEPARGPDWWLARAAVFGCRERMEMVCLERAADLGSPPGDQLLFVNLSPSILNSSDFAALVDRLPPRLVLEISECEEVGDYQRLRSQLAPLLGRGIRLAIDDTGAGYSSLRHVIELAPDFLKLDREMVRGLDQDPVRLALVRAMAAFAGEVGTHLIGEGVETRQELDALREAGVHFVQGYLTGPPVFGWASASSVTSTACQPSQDADVVSLIERLAACRDAESACSAVADHLARTEGLMPSVYLARGDTLRCMAQRGLWQVLDGMSADTGITGRAWTTGQPVLVRDVRHDLGYLEAIPGVVSEICVPLIARGSAVGALNVESRTSMPPGLLELLEAYGRALVHQLDQIGYRARPGHWQAAAHASILLSGLRPGPGVARQALGHLLRASGFDSGAIVLEGEGDPRVAASAGPLAATLSELTRNELVQLSRYVNRIRSCYSAGDPSGRCFLGTDSLRESGARAVVLLPLWAQKRRIGTAVLAHSRPLHLDGQRVEPLEMLADHAAAALVLNRVNGSRTTHTAPAHPALVQPIDGFRTTG